MFWRVLLSNPSSPSGRVLPLPSPPPRYPVFLNNVPYICYALLTNFLSKPWWRKSSNFFFYLAWNFRSFLVIRTVFFVNFDTWSGYLVLYVYYLLGPQEEDPPCLRSPWRPAGCQGGRVGHRPLCSHRGQRQALRSGFHWRQGDSKKLKLDKKFRNSNLNVNNEECYVIIYYLLDLKKI